MSLYPEQLRLKTAASIATGPNNTKVRPATQPGDVTVYTAGFTPAENLTVNSVIRAIHSALYKTYLTDYHRTREEFQIFRSAFGSKVVYPKSVAIAGAKTANDLIKALRVLWDQDNARTATKTGYATSIDAGSDPDTTTVPATTP